MLLSMITGYEERDGHWIWLGKYRAGHPETSIAGQPVRAARAIFLERHGPVLPHRAPTRRLCEETACVNPDHCCVSNPKALWKRLRRDAREIELARLWIETASQKGLSWLRWAPGEWHADPLEVRRIASSLGCDPLTVLAGWSLLCERNQRAAKRAAPPPVSRADDLQRKVLELFKEVGDA